MIKQVAGMAVTLVLSAAPAFAQTIYPIDRADILVGAKFDFKVELPGLVDQAKLKVTLNGADYAAVFGQGGTFTAREPAGSSRRCCCAMSRSPSPGRSPSKSATARRAAR